MKQVRKAVSLLLAAVMVISMTGLTALAEEPDLPQVSGPVIGDSSNLECSCGTEDGIHAEDCPLYEEPDEPETDCTCGAAEGEAHKEGCPLYEAPDEPVTDCTCGAAEGEAHKEGCPLYAAPGEPEADCTCGAAEGETHKEGCPLYQQSDDPGEKSPCSKTEGCTLEDGHEGACVPVEETPGISAAPQVKGDNFARIGDTYYPNAYQAFTNLKDGDTLYLMQDFDGTGISSIPAGGSYTIASDPDLGKKVTITPSYGLTFDCRGGYEVTLENLVIDCNGDSVQVGSATLILGEGAEIVNGSPAVTSYYSTAGTVIMRSNASITDSVLGVSIEYGLKFYMEGGSIADNYNDYHYASGIAIQDGTLVISGDAQVTGNRVKGYDENLDSIETDFDANIYVAPGMKLDLTELGSNAAIGLTPDPETKPTADNPCLLATISGEDIPAGVKLDREDIPYQLQAGKKLDAGTLLLIDPNSSPSAEIRGNGTQDDPFRVKSFEELKAAVNKVNNRSQMNYVMVDGPFSMPDDYDRIFLSGKMTLYSNNPSENEIYSPIGAMLYLSGNYVELVVEDMVVKSDPERRYTSFISTYGSGKVKGTVTINDGAVFTGFTSTILDASQCDVTVNGGVFKDSNGSAIHSEGAIIINGGTFTGLYQVASSRSGSDPAVRLGGDYTFSGNKYDFSISDSYLGPILTGPLVSNITFQATNNRKLPVLSAEDPAYLEGWEAKVSETSGLQLELSSDGKSLMVTGADRQAIRIPRLYNDSTYGTLPNGTYYIAGTQTSRGGFYISGINPKEYNGYDLDIKFTKVLLYGPDGKPFANFTGEDGEAITDEKGFITNWQSPYLEYYVRMGDGTTIQGEALSDGAIVRNIPGKASSGNAIYVRFKGDSNYLPCSAEEMFSIYGFTAANLDRATGEYKLAEGVTVTVINNEVAYTGEEVLPTVKVTIKNKALRGGEEITLKEGVDYTLRAASEEDWQVGENRTAYLTFQGNYGMDMSTYPQTGYAVKFNVVTGTMTAKDYKLTVSRDETAEQSFDLSKLTITPAQQSYTYALGSVTANDVLENISVDGSLLKFTVKGSGTATVPITVTSPNASCTANVIVTVSEKTSGPVVLNQGGKTFYFDTLSEAITYAQDGDTITLSEVVAGDVTIDKAVTIDGGKAGGISGAVSVSAKATIQECDLSGATVAIASGGEETRLTHNYWNTLTPSATNADRNQLYPFYKDAAMTILVSDPAIAVDAAIKEADELIFNKSEDLISLRDIRNKMNDPEVQKFLRGHQDDFKEILDKLENSVDADTLNAYLESNPEAKELLDLLKLAYDVACKVVPMPSEPSVDDASSNATTEAGKQTVNDAKGSIKENEAVSSYAPVFGGSVKAEELEGVTDTTMAVYLKVAVDVESIGVAENADGASIASIVFDVQPQYAVDKGAYKNLTNDKIQGNVTFRLPIPDSVTQTYAKVTHSGDPDRYITIATQDAHKYIELSASHFSTFTVTFTNTKPGNGGSSGGGSSGSSHDDDNYDFWDRVEEKIKDADSGDIIKVDAKSYDKMPWTVMEALRKNSGVSLVIKWNGGDTITIPAGKAAKAESGRIYYPLSLLEEMYKDAQLKDPATGNLVDPSKLNPNTGGPMGGAVMEITAPAVSEDIQNITPKTEGMSPDTLTMSPVTPVAEAEPVETSNNGILFAVIAAVLATMTAAGLFIWKKRSHS